MTDENQQWCLFLGLCFGNICKRWDATRTSMRNEHCVFPGWESPSLRLQLCGLCSALPQWGCTAPRIRHHDNFLNLKRSGEQGCWCCFTVCEQLVISIQDHDSPPSSSHLAHLKIPHLLLWFAKQTWTKSGYLDHLRQTGRRLSMSRSITLLLT
jgi:Fe-S-cluster-containing hydrogenase component 2